MDYLEAIRSTSQSDLLRHCGEALYGEQWQSALARDMLVSSRTMRRWVAGAPIPARFFTDLLRQMQMRAEELNCMVEALHEALS